jgi:NAD(P)H-nitrite reductase large subunit
VELDDKLCYCFHISKRKIVNFVRRERPRRASQISECFGAGTGCGWCIPFLRRIHREIVADEIVEAEDISAAEYEAKRCGYLRDLAAGTRERNRHAEETVAVMDCPRHPEEAPHPPEEPFDVAAYFSRPRPAEPEPETLT